MRVFWFVPALLLPACGGELVPLSGCDPLDKTLFQAAISWQKIRIAARVTK
jgi:hypothetical protein